MASLEGQFINLLSNPNDSSVSFESFDVNFDASFGENAVLPLRNGLEQSKRSMNGIIETCKDTSAAEAVLGAGAEFDNEMTQFQSIVEQAAELKYLRTLFQQAKTIGNLVAKKPLIISEIPNLTKFIELQEEEIRKLREQIKGNTKIHQETVHAIQLIEQSIQQKKQQVGAIHGKKERLEAAISIIETYKQTIEKEKDKFTIKFFHKSRNQAKSSYCDSLMKELRLQIESLNCDSSLPEIMNNAHKKVVKSSNAQGEITKGGSYIGTSRMLSLQRLLGIVEAWKDRGHSKILGFSTPSEYHGLKTSGFTGETVQK